MSEPPWRSVVGAAVAVLAVNAVGAAPGVLVGADTGWFEPPPLYPPTVAFPVVWTLLFTLLGVAAFLVWRHRDTRAGRMALGAFAVQLALNVGWTPAFFGLQQPWLALGILGLLWAAILATVVAFHRVDRRAAWLLLPYLAWVTFAAYLNGAIALG